MFPVALACSNTFVLKPSEKDPSVSIRLAELLKPGLPDGCIQWCKVIKKGRYSLTDSRIQAVSFVGSTALQIFMRKAQQTANGFKPWAVRKTTL